MLNAVRMDVYKMFHMKSFWVILIIMTGFVYFSTSMVKLDLDEPQEAVQEDVSAGDVEGEPDEENRIVIGGKLAEGVEEDEVESVSLGISLDSTGMTADNVTVDRLVFQDFQTMFAALFMVIFTVLFTFSDQKSGYIKHIGGQVSRRSTLVASKAVALFVYTVFYTVFLTGAQAVSASLIYGYMRWEDWKAFLVYTGVQLLLHFALLLVCMTVTMVVRSNVFSMTFAVCLCLGVMNLVYMLMDRVIHKYINKDFDTFSHTVTGKISGLALDCTSGEAGRAVFVAAVFTVIMLGINVYNIEKRDLV
ncbi:MAG: hypothetical protein IJ794_14660 [Lachnospiraceae bacterium]|nr:hypothetical protein [Lachnospiraceae bacterium]